MNSRRSRISWLSVLCVSPVVLAWGGLLAAGVHPFRGGGIFLSEIVPSLMTLPAMFLLAALGFVWIAERLGRPSPNQRTLRGMVRPARLPLAIFIAGMLTLPLAGPLGLRLGSYFGVGLQPVRDLIDSPVVAKIAASGEFGYLPEADWPESFSQWPTRVGQILVTPVPGSEPQIEVITASRGARYHRVLIQPARVPKNDDDQAFPGGMTGCGCLARLGNDCRL